MWQTNSKHGHMCPRVHFESIFSLESTMRNFEYSPRDLNVYFYLLLALSRTTTLVVLENISSN